MGKRKNSRPASAHQRGVSGIRRVVHESSLGIFEKSARNLTPKLRGFDRLFTPSTVTVTVVGFSRFSQKHKNIGPSSLEIAKNIASSRENISVQLGRLGLYGSGNAHKLAFELHSEEFTDEIENFEKEFEDRGFPLEEDYNVKDLFVPHCSIASVHKSNIRDYRKLSTLKSFNALSGVVGAEVQLAPSRLVQPT